MVKFSLKGFVLLGLSFTLIISACNSSADKSEGPTIADQAGGDGLGVDVAVSPESIPEANTGNDGEDTTPQTAVVEPPCEWPEAEISFEGNAPVYKSNTVDENTQDLSTKLSWNITTGCAPDKVIITTPNGTSEYAGARAQSGSKDILKLEATTTYSLAIVHKNELVYETSVEIPLVIMEDNFQVTVNAENKATGEQHMSWTPQQNYQDPRTYTISYSFSADLDKICIRSPHGQAPLPVQQNRILEQEELELNPRDLGDIRVDPLRVVVLWVDGAPKAPIITGHIECFDKNNSTLDAQGKNYEGEFEFELLGSTTIESYGLFNNVKIFEKSTPLNVTIARPISQFAAKRAIPDVGAEHYDLVAGGLSAVIEFQVQFNDALQVALVTDVAATLSSEATWTASDINKEIINGTRSGVVPVAKSAVCDVDPAAATTSSSIKPCTDAGFTDKFVTKVKALYPTRHMNVFQFTVHDLTQKYYYAKAAKFITKSSLIGVGYEDYLQVSTSQTTDIPQPAIKFGPSVEFGSDYANVGDFCNSQNFKNTLFSGAQFAMLSGETRGARSMRIQRSDCDSHDSEPVTNPSAIDPGVITFSSKCAYDGMNPGYTVTVEDLLGNEATEVCKFNVQMWDIKLHLTGKTDNEQEDLYSFMLEKVERTGPDPIKELKVTKVDSHCGGAFLNTPVNVEDSRDYERIFDVTNQGMSCWRIAVRARTYDGWKYVTWNTSSQAPKYTGKVWRSTSINSNTRGSSETVYFPPRVSFDMNSVSGSGNCRIGYTDWGLWKDGEHIKSSKMDFKMSGKHVNSLAVSCNRGALSGVSVSGASKEYFNNKSLSYYSGQDSSGTLTYRCTVTATGLGTSNTDSDNFEYSCTTPDY